MQQFTQEMNSQSRRGPDYEGLYKADEEVQTFSIGKKERSEIQKGEELASVMLGKSLTLFLSCSFLKCQCWEPCPTYHTYGGLNQNQDELMECSMNSSGYSKGKGLVLKIIPLLYINKSTNQLQNLPSSSFPHPFWPGYWTNRSY